jgi:hypothetical protein
MHCLYYFFLKLDILTDLLIFKKNNVTVMSMLDLLNITTAKSKYNIIPGLLKKFSQQMFSEHLLHRHCTCGQLFLEKITDQS